MQTHLQLVDNSAPSKAPSSRRSPKPRSVRTQTLAAINATWRKLCPLEGEEMRDARLAFATKALGLRKPLKSLSKCSPKQLGRIIDAMRERERAPGLPGVPTPDILKSEDAEHEQAEVIHLATSAQGTAIERLRNYLGWTAIGLQKFIIDKFDGKHSPALLTPAQANSCTYILLRIAANKSIRARGFEGRICGSLLRAEMSQVKRELGIDQKPSTTEDTEDGYND